MQTNGWMKENETIVRLDDWTDEWTMNHRVLVKNVLMQQETRCQLNEQSLLGLFIASTPDCLFFFLTPTSFLCFVPFLVSPLSLTSSSV